MKPGTKLKSAVCNTEVMVIRSGDGQIECGGAAMTETKAEGAGEPAAASHSCEAFPVFRFTNPTPGTHDVPSLPVGGGAASGLACGCGISCCI